MRVLVVGAGVIGLFVARRLTAGGAQVTVLEADLPGAGLSRTTFGWINAGFQATDHDYWALRARSIEEWHEDTLPGVHSSGSMHQEDAPVSSARLDTWVDTLRSWGEVIQTMGAEAASSLERSPDWHASRPIHRFAADGWLDTATFVDGALAELAAAGASIRTGTRVEALLDRADGPGVRLASGELVRGDAVVIAAARATPAISGIDSDRLIRGPGAPGVPGLVVVTTPTSVRVGQVLRVRDLLVRPYPDGRLMLQCGDQESDLTLDEPADTTRSRVRTILGRARAALRSPVELFAEHAWPAARAMPIDGLPVVGWLDRERATYSVLTHSGITLAPVLAHIAVDEILDGSRDVTLARYLPDRYLAGSG